MTLVWVFFSHVKQREVVIRVDEVVGYYVNPRTMTRYAIAVLYRTRAAAHVPLEQLVVVP